MVEFAQGGALKSPALYLRFTAGTGCRTTNRRLSVHKPERPNQKAHPSFVLPQMLPPRDLTPDQDDANREKERPQNKELVDQKGGKKLLHAGILGSRIRAAGMKPISARFMDPCCTKMRSQSEYRMYRRRTGGTGTAAGATLTNRGIGAG